MPTADRVRGICNQLNSEVHLIAVSFYSVTVLRSGTQRSAWTVCCGTSAGAARRDARP
jgi:hypothetical protein